MLLSCPLCEEWTVYSVCNDCRKIRHFMSIYSKERVIEILDSILSRKQDKQENKIKAEICKEIEMKEEALKGKSKLMTELKDCIQTRSKTEKKKL